MRDYSPLPTLDRLGFPPGPFDKSGIDTKSIAQEWFLSFSNAMASGDVSAVTSLFIDRSSWRDTLALTWNIRTFQDLNRISIFLSDCLKRAETNNFVLRAESVTLATPFDDLVWINGLFDFETKVGLCSGVLTLVPQIQPDGIQRWKAYGVYTNLENLKGHPEQVGHLRNAHTNHGKWQSQRDAEREFANEEPKVVICGAAQNGLNLAARLKVLGIKTLVVEKNARVGDTWRDRYEALCLHDPVWCTHLAYIPFPVSWPKFTPAMKLANWFEHYAESLELNVWVSSTITSATKDTNGNWLITVARNGSERVLKPKYFVFATGFVPGVPNIPSYPGMNKFRGKILHSIQHKRATEHVGKKVVVVGAGVSAHDICADYANHRIDVTMYQRSSTYVLSSKYGTKRLFSGLYEEGGPPVEVADRILASVPFIMSVELNQRITKLIAEDDKEVLEGLKRVGFKTNLGIFDSGLALLLFERGGGMYIDVGASQLIIDGKIKIKSDAQLQEFTEQGLKFDDGSEIDADVVLFATGFGQASSYVKEILSPELGEEFTGVWGLDEEGEIKGAWKDCGVERLWYMTGVLSLSRYYSKHVALQIKAMEEGLFGERYSK